MVRVDLSRDESRVDGVEDAQTGEPPADAVDNVGRTGIGELVDDHSEEEQVDKRPYAIDPTLGGEVGLLHYRISTHAELRVDVARGEEDIGHDVGYLEQKVVVPRHRENGIAEQDREDSSWRAEGAAAGCAAMGSR